MVLLRPLYSGGLNLFSPPQPSLHPPPTDDGVSAFHRFSSLRESNPSALKSIVPRLHHRPHYWLRGDALVNQSPTLSPPAEAPLCCTSFPLVSRRWNHSLVSGVIGGLFSLIARVVTRAVLVFLFSFLFFLSGRATPFPWKALALGRVIFFESQLYRGQTLHHVSHPKRPGAHCLGNRFSPCEVSDFENTKSNQSCGGCMRRMGVFDIL